MVDLSAAPPALLTGRFIDRGWLNIKDGPSCARASSLILARDCEIMRQMASVVEAAFADALEPVSGRRDGLVAWQSQQVEWSKEVGDIFASEFDL